MPGYLLVQSDARAIPLPDRSVHCVVTSPPYFGLRDYGTAAWEGGDDPACDHLGEPKRTQAGFNERWSGKPPVSEDKQSETRVPMGRECRKCGARRVDRQIGLESSISEYVDVMVRVFREVKRVLRDDGTLWMNMGDAMAQGKSGKFSVKAGDVGDGVYGRRRRRMNGPTGEEFFEARASSSGLAPKNLLGMPWRVAFALQADGWILRSEIIWAKLNPMPESCTDRPTKSHEQLFLLSKQSTYFYDAEAVREPLSDVSLAQIRQFNNGDIQEGRRDKALIPGQVMQGGGVTGIGGGSRGASMNPAGRNLRSVWTLPTESWPGAHFATYPRKLVEPCIKAGSSERGCCPRCGAGWVREVEATKYEPEIVGAGVRFVDDSRGDKTRKLNGKSEEWKAAVASRRTTGWSQSCQCPSHTPVPAIILDPFAGSGTTLVVANALGRRGIGLDLSREYLTNQAQRRLERPHAPHIRPARVEPALPLFGDLDP